MLWARDTDKLLTHCQIRCKTSIWRALLGLIFIRNARAIRKIYLIR